MKIKDILEDFPKIRKKRVKRLPKQHAYMGIGKDAPSVLRDPKVKHLGSGSFASAYTHKDRPHDIRRISAPSIEPDAYHKYIDALKKSPDYDNPYFPQIHEVTKYTGGVEGKETVLSVKAGRLRRISELRTEEIQAVFERWFGEDYENVLAKEYPLGGTGAQAGDLSYYMFPALVRKIIEEKKFRKKVVDQDLLRAAIFISKLLTNKVRTDLGINNLMYRRSPSGIQIVITDPVA